MKVSHVILVACGVALGFLIGAIAPATAQPQRAPVTTRFQVSAFAGHSQNGDVLHGCYTIDTLTGETWVTLSGGLAQKVSEPRVN